MEDRHLRLLLAFALAARIGAFILAGRGGVLVGEGRVYSDLAVNLLEGRGYTLSPSMLHPEEDSETSRLLHTRTFQFYQRVDGFYGVLRPGRPTLFIPPGYPLLMAAVYSVFGAGDMLAVRGLQLAAGLLTVLLGFRLARGQLSGRPLALVCLFMALDPFEIYYEAIPATQAVFSLLFMTALVLSTSALERRSALRALSASAVWGLAYHVRPAALPVMAVFLLCILAAPGRPMLRRTALAAGAAAVFLAVLSPWAVYARSVSGEWRITPTQGGVNLWEAGGRIFSSHFEGEIQGAETLYGPLRREFGDAIRKPWLAEFPEFRDEPEWVRDSILASRSIEFLAANPGLVPRLVLLRFTEFFKPFPFNDFPVHYILAGLATFGLVLLFAGAGLVLHLKSGEPAKLMLALTVVAYTLAHLASISGTPHRVALDFPLAVLAGTGYRVFRARAGAARRSAVARPDS